MSQQNPHPRRHRRRARSAARWPVLHAYLRPIHKRPSVAKAFAGEVALNQEEQARAAAAA
jgi:hypothetical protein